MNTNEEFELIIKEMDLNTYNFCDIFKYRKKLEDIQDDFDGKNLYEINDEVTFEILFLSYEIQKGDLIPLISYGDYSYPNYSLLNKNCIDYLKERFNNTNNYLLKSLYSLILWKYYESKDEKNIVYLRSFVDCSLNIITMVKSKEKISSFDYLIMQRSLISAFKIGISYNYKKTEIKNKIMDLIYDISIQKNYIKKELIELMLNNKNIFKKDDFKDMDVYCWNLYLKKDNIGYEVDFLKLSQRVANRIQSRTYNWDEEIAKCYEELMDEEESFIIKSDFCINAIQHYRKSGNKNKELELLNKLEWFNKNIELGVIEFPIDLKPLEIFIDIDLSERVLYSSIEMINYLIYSWNGLLINKFGKNRTIYDNLFICSPILMEASKKYLDINRNVRKKISSNNTEEERINEINERVFNLSLEIINKTYLDRLFIFAYENKIFSYEDIITFLSNFFNFPIDDDRHMLQFLDPLIKEYFNQIDVFLNDLNEGPIFIMFIDSVCSKIEYLLKAICSNNGLNIISVQQDGLSSMISLEKLFKNDDFKNLILESDYYFLKYVLIEPGLNLRNKSAHGLDLSIYNFSNANLLFLCFFRIIKYL